MISVREIAFFFSAGLALATAPASGNALDPLPIEVLPLTVMQDGLGGQGGERLKRELGRTQMVMIGEDHGFAGPPQFTAAIALELERAAEKPVHLVVEAGPHGTAWANGLLRKGGLPGLAKALSHQPFALPFLSNVEDARLAEPFATKGRLWGIDQEFIGSAAQLFDNAAAVCANPQTAGLLKEWAKKDRDALLAGRFDEAALSTLPLEQFNTAATSCGGGSRSLVHALSASARIYQYYSSRQYARNNEERSELMTGYFMNLYRKQLGRAPRVVFKFGAGHAGRGTSPTQIYDLASYLPPLSAENGLKSMHIAWLPLGGTVRQIAPAKDRFTTVLPYVDPGVGKLLEAAGIAPDRIPEDGYVLFPLQPLRYALRSKQRAELSELARFTLLGFDYLLTTRNAKPATHFEDWDGK